MDDKYYEQISKRLDSIDDNLKEHMRRTDILEQLHKDNQKRISLLEEPSKARKYLLNALLDFSKFTGAVIAVISLLKYFGIKIL